MRFLCKFIMPTLGAVIAVMPVAASSPVIKVICPGEGVVIDRLSDNGKWGVAECGSVTDGTIAPSGGVLFDMETLVQTDISHISGLSGVGDVSDDGSVVVGECLGSPAFWSKATGQWTKLPLPKGYGSGRLNAVTPDGQIAVGYVADENDIFQAMGVCYDLTTMKQIELPNLPELDMQNENKHQNCIFAISPDGRYLVGQLSQSYLMPVSVCTYVYDRQEASYKFIGFTENKTGRWKPEIDGIHFIDRPAMSPNGEWVAGFAYMVEEVAGTEWPREYYCTYRYNILSGTLDIFNKTDEADIAGFSVLDDGTILSATPAENPYASAMVRSGNYFISLEQILKQRYGMDHSAVTGFENTGKCVTVSGDGSRLIFVDSPSSCYLLEMDDNLAEAAAGVNLLADYTVFPKPGAVLSQLKTFTFTFERNIESNSTAKIEFSNGRGDVYNPVSSGGISIDGKKLTLTFRTRELQKGDDCLLTIPAGRFRIKGDKNAVSPEIKISYAGRDNVPAVVTEAYPADGATVSHIDLTTNPVILTFDADLALADNAAAYILREGETEPFCQLNLAVAGNRMMAYPIARQNLFNGTDYILKFPAGVVTDLSGGCANEEFQLLYHGSYVREINASDRYLFSDDCSSYDNFIYYEGDRRVPSAVPASWGFTAEPSPWLIVRSSNETNDMAMASHSMYADGGQADDWMMTPQLFIPDTDCYLSFDAQSYLNDKEDRLKIIVYESGNVYNTLNKSIVDDIRKAGVVIFDERLYPGESEEGLEGDWSRKIVRLDQFAGKDIYIAFVNENTDQSAIFLDNIQVVHDLSYITTFENSLRVVCKDSVVIKGNLSIVSDIDTYNGICMTLKDMNGNAIDEIRNAEAVLKKGDLFKFEFATPLPLAVGAVHPFSIEIKLGDKISVVQNQIKNLAFEPVKKVVLEEYSGRDCSNCPLGILAMENISKLYPGQLIPMCIRTYQGDPLGQGLSSYSLFLGMESAGAPSGRINRGRINYPMISVDGDYRFSASGIYNELTGAEEQVWLDVFREEISNPAEADIQFTTACDVNSGTVNIACRVRNALDLENANINVFAAILEDGLETYQQNGFGSLTDPDFGEWGKGGALSDPYVYPFTADDVVRTVYGTTFNGTGGLVPAKVESGKTYEFNLSVPLPSTVANPDKCRAVVMLIDAARENVLNANVAPIVNGDTQAAIDVIPSDSTSSTVLKTDEGIIVLSAGHVTVDVYNASGALVAHGSGRGQVELPLGAYKGVALVKVNGSQGCSSVCKLLF